MAAVVRIKRPLGDEPLDVVILNSKRRKIEENATSVPELSTILKFAGTTKSQEEDILKLINKPTKTDLENEFKKHNVDISRKLKAEKAEVTRDSRFKIVSYFRSNFDQTNSDLTVVDVETQKSDLSSKSDDSNYVYDLYYTNSDDFGDLDEFVSVYPLADNFIDLRDTKDIDSGDESEDSNAENYWKNDYPDESDHESIGEEDMIQAMKRVDLSDLSSDEGGDKYIYSEDSDQEHEGGQYSHFMSKYGEKVETSGLDHNFHYEDIDESEYYY